MPPEIVEDATVTVYRRPDPIPLRRTASAGHGALGVVRDEPDDLHHRVAREIFQAIDSGHFPTGSILPNEHQLGTELGVSRTALREAIKGLASKGLVETRRKRGTLVLEQDRWNMLDADVISWSRRAGTSRISEELWRSVAAILPGLAADAAMRRQVAGIGDAAARFVGTGSGEAFAGLAVEIARASGNRFLASLVTSCLDNLLAEDVAFLDRKLGGLRRQALAPLGALIVAGDADAARAVVNKALAEERVMA